MTARQGETVSLRCEAAGEPEPSIAWHKSVGTAPGGHVACGGACYTIPYVDLATSGDYICSALNGVGHPQHATVTLNVLCESTFIVISFYLQCWNRDSQTFTNKIKTVSSISGTKTYYLFILNTKKKLGNDMFVLADPPEVQCQADQLQAGGGLSVVLGCFVHGEPSPSVNWFRSDLISIRGTRSHRNQ